MIRMSSPKDWNLKCKGVILIAKTSRAQRRLESAEHKAINLV
jgi:hypothetical protein